MGEPVLGAGGAVSAVAPVPLTGTTGRVATDDESIAWYLAQPQPVASSLVRLAERVRGGHPLDSAEVAPALAAGLVLLYRYYIDGQARLLRGVKALATSSPPSHSGQ